MSKVSKKNATISLIIGYKIFYHFDADNPMAAIFLLSTHTPVPALSRYPSRSYTAKTLMSTCSI